MRWMMKWRRRVDIPNNDLIYCILVYHFYWIYTYRAWAKKSADFTLRALASFGPEFQSSCIQIKLNSEKLGAQIYICTRARRGGGYGQERVVGHPDSHTVDFDLVLERP